MGRIGEVGVRESFQVCMGWACGNLFVWDDRILGGFLSMMLVRVRKFAFGMMFGVVRAPLRRSILACSALLDSRKRQLQIIWSILTTSFNGIFSSPG
jgi:hypothetical protein